MARTLNLEIKESAEELKQLLDRQTSVQMKERLQALYLLKTGTLCTLQELSSVLVRDPSTIYRWFQKYKHEGLEGLLKPYKSPGKTTTIPSAAMGKLKQYLEENKGFKSYGEIQTWLKEECGVDVSYHVVYRAVHQKLKAQIKGSKTPKRLRKNSGIEEPQLFLEK
ncbi:helix-turn-helix domain-containing protein [Laspinema olomoucense]|uniref:Helix-turn-helix domain-containing protein n=1 Tax=Laspinema olomoucense D3b TaxID=2953688 RepID=A0ABT2N354_9CYAN|nr:MULTISPECIES: helix-turn-helix domain-containing protein [unclassified Laspinema]MCT7974602.1 helix-turn-helix domain-containing protein [Laspinema sp. D3d]MCT7977119.1 helix-turn-helix domain-containing protein [Laspinema sp. D3b]MCT7987531.1 helix-turn-helix domain-containing protein [Laspinema sp. D3a]MCT7993622.1 helix-turn-helix domain-containing protein [Laspinema sp. D3c]